MAGENERSQVSEEQRHANDGQRSRGRFPISVELRQELDEWRVVNAGKSLAEIGVMLQKMHEARKG